MCIVLELYVLDTTDEQLTDTFEGVFTSYEEMQKYLVENNIEFYCYQGVPANPKWAVFDLASHELVFASPSKAEALEQARLYSISHNPCSLLQL